MRNDSMLLDEHRKIAEMCRISLAHSAKFVIFLKCSVLDREGSTSLQHLLTKMVETVVLLADLFGLRKDYFEKGQKCVC